MNLYAGFAVWLCVGVKLYLTQKIVGGGESDGWLPCLIRERVGAPHQGLRVQLILQQVLRLILLAVTPGEPGQGL